MSTTYQDRKKTDQRKKQLKEVVKILKSCSTGDCDRCPYYGERCFNLVRFAMAEAAALLSKKEVMALLVQEAQA